MKIGKYLIIKESKIKDLKDENKLNIQHREVCEEIIKQLEMLEKESNKNLQLLKEEASINNLFINNLLDDKILKSIEIFNKTKSIRIKNKKAKSISKQIKDNKEFALYKTLRGVLFGENINNNFLVDKKEF